MLFEVGETVDLPEGPEGKQTMKIAGVLDGSVFQGVLLMSEGNFRRLFPNVAGYQYFLIEVPGPAADANRLAQRESRPQALAALLPQISGNAAYTRDHGSGAQDQPNFGSVAGGGPPFTEDPFTASNRTGLFRAPPLPGSSQPRVRSIFSISSA